jgi:diadenosine tetraphosphate (Ap4A) HIT family hydrolase
MRAMLRPALLVLFCIVLAPADTRQCACDPAKPETMAARECGLCREAEKQPPDVPFFTLKDINPRKPNRWLVLPRRHIVGPHHLYDLPSAERAALWRYAIKVGREKFGEDWGIAYNGDRVRTQCHLHLHVGRFIKAAENSNFIFVKRVEDFPAPREGGIWVHPVPGGFHAHTGEEIMETALVR